MTRIVRTGGIQIKSVKSVKSVGQEWRGSKKTTDDTDDTDNQDRGLTDKICEIREICGIRMERKLKNHGRH